MMRLFGHADRFPTIFNPKCSNEIALLRGSSRSDVQFGSVSDVGCCPPQVLQGAVELGLRLGLQTLARAAHSLKSFKRD